MLKSIMIFVLCLLISSASQALAGIEIFIEGHKYPSLEAYQDSKKKALAKSPVIIGAGEAAYIQKEAEKLGLKVDVSRIKTFVVKPHPIASKEAHRLYVQGVENSLTGALRNFYSSQKGMSLPEVRLVDAKTLPDALKATAVASDVPKLLIADAHKVRIMALKNDN